MYTLIVGGLGFHPRPSPSSDLQLGILVDAVSGGKGSLLELVCPVSTFLWVPCQMSGAKESLLGLVCPVSAQQHMI